MIIWLKLTPIIDVVH